MKVACVEKRGALGGTCLNVGCIPSKALLHSSHMYEDAVKHFPNYGITATNVTFDLSKMMGQKSKAVTGLTRGIEGLFKKNKVDYVKGFGRLSSPTTIAVTKEDNTETTLTADKIIIATGSEPSPLPGNVIPIDEKIVVSSTGALSLTSVPKKLVVVGGGVIGLELGSVYRRLGSEVTVVEFLDRITPSLDNEIGKTFQRILEKQGMKFKLGTKVVGGDVRADGVTVHVEPAKGGDRESIEADIVLVSTGRRPYTEKLGVKELGVEMDKAGRILVNDHFQTNVKSVYAIGDCIPGPMLAHKAEEEGIACVEIMAGTGGHVNYQTIPGVIYTYPEVATVGQTEEQLKEANIKYRKGTFPFMANSRAKTNDTAEGSVKMLADAETDRILGVHIIGPNAGEMIAEAVLAMEYGASSEDVARTCHAHPTLSEALKEAAMATYDKPIHM
eukprot:GILJ01001044.1.p1 GENE.GILJ01001044.1~~GILJ01001044.1.p1  ORF type:complete len:515 (-),score=89.89 GILJ01001044.1:35-1366(-)